MHTIERLIDISDINYIRKFWKNFYQQLKISEIKDGKRNDDLFVEHIVSLLDSDFKFKSKTQSENIAINEYGISDQKVIKELSEYAVIVASRNVALSVDNLDYAYNKIVGIYNNQPLSTHQTGQSITLSQYSTPVPISYLMGKYVNLDTDGLYFEPTAGNGMLTIAGNPENIIVNELDKDRLSILRKQGFKEILNQNALDKFPFTENYFDGIIANPPFGGSDKPIYVHDMRISGLEQQIIAKSLYYLKDNAKGAFIIGGHTEYDELGRLKKMNDKGFFNMLARYYWLDDVINVSGQLYGRQGTFYPVRILLIKGRKQNPEGYYPILEEKTFNTMPFSHLIVNTFGELKERFKQNL